MQNRKAFSLIEVIIAFSILSITIIAATSLISDTIRNSQENVLRVQAYFLAQEGLERVRAHRDTLMLNGTELTSLQNLQDLQTSNTLPTLPENSPLSLNLTIEKFDQQAFSITNENKDQSLLNPDKHSNHAYLVTATVEYQFRNQEKNITLTTVLTDWRTQ